MQMTTGMSLSEHIWAKALAVLPADCTMSTLSSFFDILAQTEKASVSLNEQVWNFAPILG